MEDEITKLVGDSHLKFLLGKLLGSYSKKDWERTDETLQEILDWYASHDVNPIK